MNPKIYVGTSGFSYKEWKGILYPEDLPPAEYLSHYAQHFSTTEINNTFYRIPSQKMTAGWMEKVGPDFRFALKLTQRVTHRKRLQNVDEEMEWFMTGATPLEKQLGCLLVQLPPWLKSDLDSLKDFLHRFTPRARLALEFRHESWFSQETYEALEKFGAALVLAETDDRAAVRQITAPFLYLRLRKDSYSQESLQEWAEWVKSTEKEAFVYFKHALEAPRWAEQLSKLCV